MYGLSIGAIAFDFCNLKGHRQGHSDFKGLYISRNGAELGHVLRHQ